MIESAFLWVRDIVIAYHEMVTVAILSKKPLGRLSGNSSDQLWGSFLEGVFFSIIPL
jgi:hypothetical protein